MTVIENDVIFVYGGKTLTAKGEAKKVKTAKEDYLKFVRFSNGKLIIADEL